MFVLAAVPPPNKEPPAALPKVEAVGEVATPPPNTGGLPKVPVEPKPLALNV